MSLQNYHQYHTNFWNKVIHVITVPIVVASFLALANLVSVAIAPCLILLYVMNYMTYDPALAFIWFCMFSIPVHLMGEWMTESFWWPVIIAIHALAWGIQIVVGHMIFEGNRPALMNGAITDAIIMAPLFVVIELIDITS